MRPDSHKVPLETETCIAHLRIVSSITSHLSAERQTNKQTFEKVLTRSSTSDRGLETSSYKSGK